MATGPGQIHIHRTLAPGLFDPGPGAGVAKGGAAPVVVLGAVVVLRHPLAVFIEQAQIEEGLTTAGGGGLFIAVAGALPIPGPAQVLGVESTELNQGVAVA